MRLTARRVVVLLVLALVFYVGFIGYRGVYLVEERSLVLKVFGIAVLVIPVIGVLLVGLELRFGLATQRLAERLADEGDEADPDLPRTSAGRVDRAAADALFARRRDELEAGPEDWRRWYRLAVAYDLAGDRRRAREAMRTAIARAAPPPP